MQKIFCLLITVFIIFCASACRKSNNVSSDFESQAETVSDTVSPDMLTSSDTATDILPSSDISSVESAVSTPSQPISKQEPTSSIEVPVKPQGYVLKDYGNILEKFTVNDPENTRGLSTEKHGFGFGIATGGLPHSISVNNQLSFDSMANVEALALDTVSTDKRMYLTFDCGYEYKNLTNNILDTLKAKNIKAAFFVTLSYVKKNPQIIERMINEGHIIGNHTATHPEFWNISRTEMAEEIYKVDEYLYRHFNYKTKYFRFPSGEYSECSLELATSLGYKSTFWSLAYKDYDTANQIGAENAYKTVTDRFHSGAVILLHSVSQDNADILGRVIDKAHSEGYVFKTLDEYYNK